MRRSLGFIGVFAVSVVFFSCVKGLDQQPQDKQQSSLFDKTSSSKLSIPVQGTTNFKFTGVEPIVLTLKDNADSSKVFVIDSRKPETFSVSLLQDHTYTLKAEYSGKQQLEILNPKINYYIAGKSARRFRGGSEYTVSLRSL